MTQHPNALVSAGTGISLGPLVIYVASLFHVSLDAYAGAAIATAISGAALFVGRNGLAGVWRAIVHGSTVPPPNPPPPPAPPAGG